MAQTHPLSPIPALNHNHWFILGRESLIAAAEIDAVLSFPDRESGSRFTIGKNYSPQILKVDELSLRGATSDVAIPKQTPPNHGIATPSKGRLAMTDPKTLINRLGGTIKIAKELADNIDQEKMEELILTNLKTVPGKINFGISIYSYSNDAKENLVLAENFGKKIKKTLKEEGLSVRYVENKEAILSSVTVEKNNLTGRGREFLIQKHQKNLFSVAQTEAVQPFEQFSSRDFGRPGRDDLSGMLPPKLAMILINLTQASLDSTLLDPFCGSGTILSEAMLLGYNNLIGTDISEKAISDSKKNVEWIAQKFQISNDKFQIKYQISNVENISNILPAKSIDAIATEPYLGKPLRGQETKQELLSQAKELHDLYLQAFQQFHKILKPNGKIVFIIPRFKYGNEWITIDCKNEIENMGFKTLPFFENQLRLVYARPNQRVAREIWRFEKT